MISQLLEYIKKNEFKSLNIPHRNTLRTKNSLLTIWGNFGRNILNFYFFYEYDLLIKLAQLPKP